MSDKFFDQLVSLPEDKARLQCRIRVRTIYDNLAKKAKRIRPENFVPLLVSTFRQPPKGVVLPPHVILQAIEANCSYHKNGYDEQATWGKLAEILNIFLSEDFNPYLVYVIRKNVNLLMQYMHRSQFDIQKTESSQKDLVRYWKLFAENEFTPKLHSDFENTYSISVEKWFRYSLAAYAMLRNDLMISRYNIKIQMSLPFSNEDFQKYFDLSIMTAQQVKEKYFESRKNIDPEFYFLIRTCFLERPILQLSNNKLISPIPELIFRHVGYGLYGLFENLDKNGYYIGKSLQSYTRSVLEDLKITNVLIDNNSLEKIAKGQKSCDYILSTEHENILIECKATIFKVNTLTQNAIANHTSTTNICRGIAQIHETLKQIEQGKFDSLGIDKRKPFIGIIITFGEIPEANSDWYSEEITPNNVIGAKSSDYDGSSKLIVRKPLILSLNALENLVTLMNNSEESLVSIYDQKEKEGYISTGDWERFLIRKLSALEKVVPLTFIKSVMEEFYKRLGLNNKIKQANVQY